MPVAIPYRKIHLARAFRGADLRNTKWKYGALGMRSLWYGVGISGRHTPRRHASQDVLSSCLWGAAQHWDYLGMTGLDL
jgi:hypothetical protein